MTLEFSTERMLSAQNKHKKNVNDQRKQRASRQYCPKNCRFGGNFAGKLGHDRQFPQARFLPCGAYLPWQCLGLLAMSPQLSEDVEAELWPSEDSRFS